MDLIKKQEQKRVDRVRALIAKRIGSLNKLAEQYKTQIVDIRKHFWDDVTIGVDHIDDVMETYHSIKQQAEVLSERERSHKHTTARLKSFIRLQDSPYFGRIDFEEDGTGWRETVYIGTASLLDEDENSFLIYDWRAPISSMYYDFGPGPASYDTPSGVISGEMTLKRQYIIHNGIIESLFDTTLTIGDEMLQQALGRSASTQMRNIVATIQKEQNKIIRADRQRYLIVQGPAGSGKTSAALQRVAYLLYKYRNSLGADQIVLFSPNSMFNSYVSTVLPDLGEENMQQTTFQEYLHHRLSRDFDVEDPLEQMETMLTSEGEADFAARAANIRYKSSPAFVPLLHQFGESLRKHGMAFKNLTFQGRVLISAVQMERKFYAFDERMKLHNRIHELALWLIEELRRLEKEERKQDWVQEQIQYLSSDDYQQVHKVLQKKARTMKKSFDEAKMENKLLCALVVKRHFRPLRSLIKKLRFIDMPAIYSRLFDEDTAEKLVRHAVTQAAQGDAPAVNASGAQSSVHAGHGTHAADDAEGLVLPPEWVHICEFTKKQLEARRLPYEDATPYLYLKELIEGARINTQVRHVILDEGQDYTPFQYEFLKRLFPRANMTVLGDINQAIFTSGAFYQAETLEDIFGAEQTEIIRFRRSYRSTRQIVEFTRSMLADGHLIEPFHRDGPLPAVTIVPDDAALAKHTVSVIHEWLKEGLTTIAVICKTEQAAKALSAKVAEAGSLQFKPQFISKHAVSFEKGVLFIPSYLAKGMEFDAVLISDASAAQYSESERKLLYTSCTRAMHALHVQAVQELSPIIAQAQAGTFELKHWEQ